MLTNIVAWIATALAFAGLDAVWLSQMGPRLYRPIIGDLMSARFDAPSAIAFYLIYVTGIVFFAVLPGIEKASLAKAAINGAALGFIAYATYDLSNQATLRGWDVKLTLIDMAWGTALTAIASAVGYIAASRVG